MSHSKEIFIDMFMAMSLADRHDIAREFPIFGQLRAAMQNKKIVKTGCCGSARVARNDQLTEAFNSIKNYLISMSQDQKNRFKSLLNADKITFVVADKTGRTVKTISF